MTRGYRRLLPIVTMGFGVGLVGVSLAEILLRMSGRIPTGIPFWASVTTSAPFALYLMIGGYWLKRSDVPEVRYPRVLAITMTGMMFLGGFFTIIGVTFRQVGIVQTLSPIRWGLSVGGGSGLLLAFLNAQRIEKELASERELIRSAELEERRELLNYLNALLRHEVLNTANVIEGYATGLMESLDGDEKDNAATIRRQARELTVIIDDVRFLLRAAGENPSMEPTNLSRMLRDELTSLQDRHPEVDIDRDIPDEVYVAADLMLKRLLSNLLENAVEHNPDERPWVSAEVSVTDDTAAVRIEDNGPGVPETVQSDLFKPAQKWDDRHGLGLLIVKRLANRYDGRIELTETGPDGSVFTVELPLATT
ncbi:sensor histidine kinase [Halogeometricum borinquense]|nr:HAMP domain-containing sensor histidine kinase [Halogeometricum borinquense]